MDDGDPIWERALRLLGRRMLTTAELREALMAAGAGDDAAEAVLVRLRSAGYLDDERLALEIVLRRARQGHAPARVEAELARRGIPAAQAERAWRAARLDHGIVAERLLNEQLRRRIGRAALPLDPRTGRRVYNALLRAGFPADEVRAALESYLIPGEDEVDPGYDETAEGRRPGSRLSVTGSEDDGQ